MQRPIALLFATISLTVVLTAPAAAQLFPWNRKPPPPPPPHAPPANAWSLERREYWLDRRIARGLADGALTPAEAERARHELTDIRYQEQRLRSVHNGMLIERDRLNLELRLDELMKEIHWLRDTGERRPW